MTPLIETILTVAGALLIGFLFTETRLGKKVIESYLGITFTSKTLQDITETMESLSIK